MKTYVFYVPDPEILHWAGTNDIDNRLPLNEGGEGRSSSSHLFRIAKHTDGMTTFFFVLLVSGDDVNATGAGRAGCCVTSRSAPRTHAERQEKKNKISRVRTRALEFFLLTDLTFFTKAYT